MADDQWKDGVPPAPEGVRPADTPYTAPPSTGPLSYEPATLPPRPETGAYNAVSAYGSAPAYGGPPVGAASSTSKNWMGLTSMILGIIGGGLLAIIFGVMGIRAANRGEATNKGQAVAGIVLTGAWFVVGIIVAVIAVAAGSFSTGAFGDQGKDYKDVVAGDCYTSDLGGDPDSIEYVDVAFGECDESSNALVYYVTTVPAGSAPTDDGFVDVAYNECVTDAALTRVNIDLVSQYYVEEYFPDTMSWAGGERWLICGMVNELGPVDEAAFN